MCFPPILFHRLTIDTNAPSIIHRTNRGRSCISWDKHCIPVCLTIETNAPSIIHRTNAGKSCISWHKHCIPVCFYCIHPPLSVVYQSSAPTNRCCFLLVVVIGMSINVFVCEFVCVVVHRSLLIFLPKAWTCHQFLLLVNDIIPLHRNGYHSFANEALHGSQPHHHREIDSHRSITTWQPQHHYRRKDRNSTIAGGSTATALPENRQQQITGESTATDNRRIHSNSSTGESTVTALPKDQ